MIERLRAFLTTTAGKVVSVLVVVLAASLAFFSLRSNFGSSDAASVSGRRMYIDANTGKAFDHILEKGERVPIQTPSGEKAGYPAEPCYWTKDGKAKTEPTWVLLNVYSKKPGPTFCPDCGRLVVGHNPPPAPGESAPPTAANYKAPARED